MSRDYFDAHAFRPHKGGAWCYEDGCLYRGLEFWHRETGEACWIDHLHRLADAQIGPDGALAGYALSDYNIDNVLSGRALLYLHAQTGEALLARIAALCVPEGFCLQVIDLPDLPGNYQETSASAMFTQAMLRGARLGLATVPDGLERTWMTQALRSGADGCQAMVEICEVAGLGWYEGRFRDGSAEYHMTEARVVDDVKGVGPLMMAAVLAPR